MSNQFGEALLVKIADRRIASSFDPFGMLTPQVVMDLPLQFRI